MARYYYLQICSKASVAAGTCQWWVVNGGTGDTHAQGKTWNIRSPEGDGRESLWQAGGGWAFLAHICGVKSLVWSELRKSLLENRIL